MNLGKTVEVQTTQTVLLIAITDTEILHVICAKVQEYVLPVEVMEYMIPLMEALQFVLTVIMESVNVAKEQAKFMA